MNAYLNPRVSSDRALLALGTMNFGKRTPKPEAIRIVHQALDSGIALLDTANAYNDGESERIVGAAVKGREGCLVATKVGASRTGGRLEGLSAARILAACDESLARLGVDVIDLYYLHIPDTTVPIEESVSAMAKLLECGKIRNWGVSNYASWEILEILAVAKENSVSPPLVAQQLYNALVRQLDIEYFKFTRRYPLHTTVYNPLAGGLLAGHHAVGAAPKASRFGNPLYRGRYWHEAMFGAVERIRAVAAAEGLSMVQLAYAFALGRPGVDSVLVGPGSVAHLADALEARGKEVSPEGLALLATIHQDLIGTDASYAR